MTQETAQVAVLTFQNSNKSKAVKLPIWHKIYFNLA